MTSRIRLLIAEDDVGAGEALLSAFSGDEFDPQLVRSGGAARDAFRSRRFDVVLTDVVMPDVDGLTLLKEFVQARDAPPVIVMTAYGSVERAVSAMKMGAHDFLEKPLDIGGLRAIVRNAVADRQGEAERRSVRSKLGSDRRSIVVGKSPFMARVMEQAERVARTNATVLLQGQSGTGKELIARLIHRESLRVGAPFVPVNCAGLTESIIESELFGHVKGAFTGAVRAKKGKFELADRGTLFLDEIGEIPLPIQVKLLRVLQEREVEPVGGEEPVRIDVRLICATHRDLEAMVREGRFREDLYYRIKVIVLRVPSLRERAEDIPELARHFLDLANEVNQREVQGFTAAALERLQAHGWPGNVRELQNAVEQAVVLARGREIDVADLPPEVTGDRGPREVLRVSVGTSLAQTEKDLILETLRKAGGNKTMAAKMLGIGVRTLYRKLEEYGAK